MSIKVLILFFCLAGFSQHIAAVEANCTCTGSANRTPEYCTSEFLSIVKITRVVIDKTQEKQHNYFELVTDLTYQVDRSSLSGLIGSSNQRTSLKGFQTINESIDECAHQLKVNQTYLIGSDFKGEGDKRQPTLIPCTSWVEPWDYSSEKSNVRLAQYNSECTVNEETKPTVPDDNHSLKNPGK